MYRLVCAFAASAFLATVAWPADAKMVTKNDVSVNVPAGFTVSDYDNGMKTESADGEMDVWFERTAPADVKSLMKDHIKYWDDNEVKLPDAPTEREDKTNAGLTYKQMDFGNATWKGKPTIVRYLFLKQQGTDDMIIVSIWSSPKGETAHIDDVSTMLDSAKLK